MKEKNLLFLMFSYILLYNFVECVPKTVEYDLEVIYNLHL